MRNVLLASVLCAALTACGTCPTKVEQKVVVQTEYVIRIPPAETMTPPPAVQVPDPDKSTQKDVAKYINNLEGQITALQNKLIEIAKFFEDEKAKLAKEAAEKNKAPATK
jgi:hypothetical protein